LANPIPAVVGPFDLGTVVVRGGLSINLATTSVSIAAEPIPTILSGIPLRIKSMQVRTAPDFMVNPTSCVAEQTTAIVDSREGASATLSTPFQATGCASLAFAPTLTVTTEAPASRRDGVGVDLAIAYPAGPQANASKLVVELPRQVRGRLSTIQQTCRAERFAQSPAQCPPGAKVGSALVTTKVLPSPLAGPIYLVGGGLLPHLAMTVQGDGISDQLTGKFVISKHGVTSAIFEGMPDAPLSSIAIDLPRGPHSVLGTNTDLCKGHLTVSYSFTARTGAHLARTTKLTVARGCSAAGRAARRRAKDAGHAAGR
jgi:hypothetical protein